MRVQFPIFFNSSRCGAGVMEETAFLIVVMGSFSMRLMEIAAVRFSRFEVPKSGEVKE